MSCITFVPGNQSVSCNGLRISSGPLLALTGPSHYITHLSVLRVRYRSNDVIAYITFLKLITQ